MKVLFLISAFGVRYLFFNGLETGCCSALVKLFKVIILVYGKLYPDAALPTGIFDSVHKLNAFDTFLTVNEKLFLTEDSSGEVIDNTSVLTAHALVGF